MTERPGQLAIPLERHALKQFDNFHPGRNAELVSQLRALPGTPGFLGWWLWGEPGRGRSHLLQASCHAAGAGGRAVYLPLGELPRDPGVLEGLAGELIALDDVDAWLGDRTLELALLALYQERLGGAGKLLVAGRLSAQRSAFCLPDLASRARALTGYEVFAPDDEGLRVILSQAARRQGLELTPGVLDYWLHRSARSLPVLLDQLAALDAESMALKRRVTIPLLKEVLAL